MTDFFHRTYKLVEVNIYFIPKLVSNAIQNFSNSQVVEQSPVGGLLPKAEGPPEGGVDAAPRALVRHQGRGVKLALVVGFVAHFQVLVGDDVVKNPSFV